MTLDRDALARLAGLNTDTDDYTPATIGKGNRVTVPRNVWADQMYNLNFQNVEEMKAYPLTTASAHPLYADLNGHHSLIEGQYAVMDDNTNEFYSIHSEKYNVIQHDTVKQAMAYACEDTDMSVFGHFDQSHGRMNGYATFADPNGHIQLGVDHADPVMLGMRFFNSHNGDSRFGGEIFGIRKICGNYMAWGEVLGEVSVLHYKNIVEDTAKELGKILESYRDSLPHLKDLVHERMDELIDPAEQIDALWGTGIGMYNVTSIVNNRNVLNPENTHDKVSVYDLYNASTAYVTYRVGGNHMVNGNLEMSKKITGMLTLPTNKLIERGQKLRQAYEERIAKPTLTGAVRVRQVA